MLPGDASPNSNTTRDGTYCSGQQAFVRTKDTGYCFVGQYCDCETTYCAQSFFQGSDNSN